MSINQRWHINPLANSHNSWQFAECIADIAESVSRVNDLLAKGQLTTHSFRRAARDISVAIRKIMFQGNGHLFKTFVKPTLHPLKKPRNELLPDVIIESHGGMAIKFTVGGSGIERTKAIPPYEHRTVVNPLYGLRKTGDQLYQLDNPFDLSQRQIKFKRWMKTKVLQVGEDEMTVMSILKLVANKDGAHADSSEETYLSASLPVPVRLPDDNDELFRKGHWVTFGGISYLHIFTVLVGVYLVTMMNETLKHIPDERKRRLQIDHLSRTIAKCPAEIRGCQMMLEKRYSIGTVVDSKTDLNNPFELVGDYKKVGTTTIQIPGWKLQPSDR